LTVKGKNFPALPYKEQKEWLVNHNQFHKAFRSLDTVGDFAYKIYNAISPMYSEKLNKIIQIEGLTAREMIAASRKLRKELSMLSDIARMTKTSNSDEK